ncbi:MAG: hypothetical protein JST19_10985 [Bacteroidetes bacterium]|nr:hypothetical protein [Bacteroidota bacterium]
MKRCFLILSCLLFAVCLNSCKKDKNTDVANPFATAIIGNWVTNKQVIKIYTTGGTLVKDTTLTLNGQNSNGWFASYGPNGSGILYTQIYSKKSKTNTPLTDTVLVYTYMVTGSNLSLFENGNLNSEDDYTIVSLNATSMQQQSNYLGLPEAGWGLDVNTQYNFIENDYYTKQ